MEYFPELHDQLREESAAQLARDLCALAPAEVVALHRYVDSRFDERGELPMPDDEERVYRGMDSALDMLPAQDVDFARAVYTQYAESPDPVDRSVIATKLHHLTLVDHGSGIELWDHLLRDHDRHTRNMAHERFFDYEQALKARDYARADTALVDLGLSWREARQLLDAYEDAQSGEHIFDLGEVALQRLVAARQQDR